MNAVVALLGGWRASLFLVLAVGFMALSALNHARLTAAQTTHRLHLANDLKANAAAMEAARETEYQHRLRVGQISAQLQRDHKATTDALTRDLAALRAGALRVRHDRTCPVVPASGADAGGAATAPGVYLPADAQERVLRVGGDADTLADHYRACYAQLQADREVTDGR